MTILLHRRDTFSASNGVFNALQSHALELCGRNLGFLME
jgi:hypothetical protein